MVDPAPTTPPAPATPPDPVAYPALTLGAELGRGGQGSVYAVENRKITTSDGDGWGAVYKEYHASVRPDLDTAALAAMVGLPAALDGPAARWLCEKTTWPASLVERDGETSGFLMRAVPDRFTFTLLAMTAAGTGGRRLRNVEYLLNDDAYVAGIGLAISDRDRLAVLADLAATLTRLHRIGVTVGDLSPKNLLFASESAPECLLIDCDAMLVHGAGVLPQVETPDWRLPSGEQPGTRAGDVYKLGLLAVRLFARDQSATDPAALAAHDPALGDLARASLDPDPDLRPSPAAWAERLAVAVANAPTVTATVSATAGATMSGAGWAGWRAWPPQHPGSGTATAGPATGPLQTAASKRALAIGATAAVVLIVIAIVAAAISSSHSPPASLSGSGSGTSGSSAPNYSSSNLPGEPQPSGPGYSRLPAAPPPPPPDVLDGVQDGDCFYDNGTNDIADLVATGCAAGAFQVVRVNSDTTDLNSCNGVTDSDESVSSAQDNLVVCLSYQSGGGDAFHAQQGDCVYGPDNSTDPWSVVPCQTGNFKVLASYRGNTDASQCQSWPHYNEWKSFTVSGNADLDVLLCMSMNYPDDAGYATLNECLVKSGNTFTDIGSCTGANVYVTGRTGTYDDPGFCGNDGSTWWENSDYPDLAYTVCWAWTS